MDLLDTRTWKAEHEYNSAELLRTQIDELRQNNELQRANAEASQQAAERLSGELQRWRLQSGASRERLEDSLSARIHDLQTVLGNGYADLRQTFEWGLSGLYLKLDLQHRSLERMADAITSPIANQGREQREQGEKAVLNGWYEEAVKWLGKAIETNSLDYLAHFELAHVSFFRFDQIEVAWTHFELAAKYASRRDAGTEEKFYAALSFAHLSLLSRLKHPEAAVDALVFAERGYRADQSCLPAVLEFLYVLCLAKQDQSVPGIVTQILREHEDFLEPISNNSDLRRCPTIQSAVAGWEAFHRERIEKLASLQSIVSVVDVQNSLNERTPRRLALQFCDAVIGRANSNLARLQTRVGELQGSAEGEKKDAENRIESVSRRSFSCGGMLISACIWSIVTMVMVNINVQMAMVFAVLGFFAVPAAIDAIERWVARDDIRREAKCSQDALSAQLDQVQAEAKAAQAAAAKAIKLVERLRAEIASFVIPVVQNLGVAMKSGPPQAASDRVGKNFKPSSPRVKPRR